MTNRLYTITNKKSGEIVAMVEASTPHQAYSRLCQSDYEISVTRAIDVGAHIRNRGRVITTPEPNTIHGPGDDHQD